ncbi:MAG TPA: hypothetical protein DIV41_08040 [Ruminococcaceae bacterium]|nr:hypothetical protein [Oscillospiraceae bacterium]
MKKPFKLFTAVLCAALALPVCFTGCGLKPAAGASPAASVQPVPFPTGVSSARSGSSHASGGTASSGPAKEKSAAGTSLNVLDNSVFIGDSVTLKLQKYVAAQRKKDGSFFGGAEFLTAGGMGSGNALEPLGKSSIHPYFNGKKAILEDSVKAMGAKSVYIMLGMNDIAVYGIDGSAENLEKLVKRIIRKNEGIKVYIQSVTPIIKEKQKSTLNNENIEKYNNILRQLCSGQSWSYVDVASVVRGEDGSLRPEYCSDPDDLGMHFTDNACQAWVKLLLSDSGAKG